MPFKNLPTETAAPLASLIEAHPGQVSSMGLTRFDDPVSATLLAFAEGESVAAERYPGDTLYYLVDGTASIAFANREISMSTGDVLCVPAHVEHAVEPAGAIKLLQITLP